MTAERPVTFGQQVPAPSPTSTHPSAPTRSPRQDAQRPPKPRHPARPDPAGQRIHSFRDVLAHLATLTRNELRYGQAVVPALAEPTPDQRRAFDLIDAAMPLTLNTT